MPKPRVPNSTSKIFPDFGFHKQKFPGFRNPNCLTRGESYIELSVKREWAVKGCFLLLGKLLLVRFLSFGVGVVSVFAIFCFTPFGDWIFSQHQDTTRQRFHDFYR